MCVDVSNIRKKTHPELKNFLRHENKTSCQAWSRIFLSPKISQCPKNFPRLYKEKSLGEGAALSSRLVVVRSQKSNLRESCGIYKKYQGKSGFKFNSQVQLQMQVIFKTTRHSHPVIVLNKITNAFRWRLCPAVGHSLRVESNEAFK